MIQFKAGDRVAVYSSEIRSDGEHATVSTVYSGGIITVKMDFAGDKIDVYSQQLRRLKPRAAKAPVERKAREFWVKPGSATIQGSSLQHISGPVVLDAPNPHLDMKLFIHVTELKPGQIVIDRETLAKAFTDAWDSEYHPDLTPFQVLCKALGLGSDERKEK